MFISASWPSWPSKYDKVSFTACECLLKIQFDLQFYRCVHEHR